jgi:hypothetical protein
MVARKARQSREYGVSAGWRLITEVYTWILLFYSTKPTPSCDHRGGQVKMILGGCIKYAGFMATHKTVGFFVGNKRSWPYIHLRHKNALASCACSHVPAHAWLYAQLR